RAAQGVAPLALPNGAQLRIHPRQPLAAQSWRAGERPAEVPRGGRVAVAPVVEVDDAEEQPGGAAFTGGGAHHGVGDRAQQRRGAVRLMRVDRKSTRLNSS